MVLNSTQLLEISKEDMRNHGDKEIRKKLQ
jgi:hypothetical protein